MVRKKKKNRLADLDIVMAQEVKNGRLRESVYLLKQEDSYGVLVESIDGLIVYSPFYGDIGILQARRTPAGIKSVICWADRATALARYIELLASRDAGHIKRVVNGSVHRPGNVCLHPLLTKNENKQPC